MSPPAPGERSTRVGSGGGGGGGGASGGGLGGGRDVGGASCVVDGWDLYDRLSEYRRLGEREREREEEGAGYNLY